MNCPEATAADFTDWVPKLGDVLSIVGSDPVLEESGGFATPEDIQLEVLDGVRLRLPEDVGYH